MATQAARKPGSKRRQNEARILAAAEAVFAETGFSGATTAAIAERAGLPKANLHYYYRTKKALYRRLLETLLDLWLATGDQIAPAADPAEALASYIAAKVAYSRERPCASKVFANELLHGAPQVGDYLRRQVRQWVEAKAAVLDGWVAEGRMAPVDARHLFFVIWAATQTYADFDVQVAAVLGRAKLRGGDYDAAAGLITRMVLSTCGLAPANDFPLPPREGSGEGAPPAGGNAKSRLRAEARRTLPLDPLPQGEGKA